MAERTLRTGSSIRCAIYTRKSTEEGLEQDFNSLDAQREACAAYILSQRQEGWNLVPTCYDDGGYSGGSMERPALQMLLADIAAGKVDVIVVYKVDRLTRSLADFARIVDVLDAKRASFVSVTQAFNTTTSMGRLTLNVLLSFAQFEREVTGERIRDKIAASKARGMWMGGVVPLGYRVEDRKLVPEPAEAELVRHMFRRYLELGSGRELAAELARQGIVSKLRINRHGRQSGGQPMTRGAIYWILKNRLYLGEIAFRGKVYPGQHAAIVDRALFEAVQGQIALGRLERTMQVNAEAPSLLAGVVWDAHGRRMSPSHAGGGRGKRYRYYVSQTDDPATKDQPVFRVSAPDLEDRVVQQLSAMLERSSTNAIQQGSMGGERLQQMQAAVVAAAQTLATSGTIEARQLVRQIIQRIEVRPDSIHIAADLSAVDPILAVGQPVTAQVPIAAVRIGKQLKLVVPPGEAANPSRKDPALIKLVVRALTLRKEVAAGTDTIASRSAASRSAQPATFDALAASLGYSREHAADLLRISYLAPDILTAILDGRQPEKLTRTALIKTPRLPLAWAEQRKLLGFS